MMRRASSRPAELVGKISPLVQLLRCLHCCGPLYVVELGRGDAPELGPDGMLRCRDCAHEYRMRAGTARLVRDISEDETKRRTAEGYAYEWEHFGQLRPEWRKNFLEYMLPHDPESFSGRLVLDVGAGSGRHSRQAAELGADVVAVDLGDSIDVARRNLPGGVLTVQADAEDLPFDFHTFDLVMSIGVLHHLPDPERAFRSIARYARPGGFVQIYVYWLPERPMHRAMLRLVHVARRLTTRMPYRLLHAASYPIAASLFLVFVLPYRVLRRLPRLGRFSDAFPLKAYADYPFRVCVNDQFDRFSAPIEHRYTAEEVERWFRSAGLEAISVLPSNGWVASGRVRLNE